MKVLALAVPLVLGLSLAQGQVPNDMFANRILITGTNITVTGSNVGATREAGEPYHADETGGASVWWSWTAPRSDPAILATTGSTFDTLLAVYTGTSVTALTEVASNDDDPEGEDYTSKLVFNATAGQAYQIAVDGYYGDYGSVKLTLKAGPLPPPPPAPAWVLPDPYGQIVSSASLAGKVVVLDFWATWCGPCKVEIPDLTFLQNKYRADGLVIVGASVDTTAQAVRDFMAIWSPPLSYQVVMSDSTTEQAYGGIQYIPTTFIIDRQNLIRAKYVGTQTRSTFEKQIVPLLYANACLACRCVAGQPVLCWPTNAVPFTLESATGVANPAWSAWPTLPTVVNGVNTVSVPPTNSIRYFRLRLPY